MDLDILAPWTRVYRAVVSKADFYARWLRWILPEAVICCVLWDTWLRSWSPRWGLCLDIMNGEGGGR
jgi:hypothetical protein